MNNKIIPLGGQNVIKRTVQANTNNERIGDLEYEIDQLKKMVEKIALINRVPINNINLDNIPVGITLIGITHDMKQFILKVGHDGYYHEDTKYQSLSAAAEAVTGKRRNGWDFWRATDGQSAKEAFKRGDNERET